MQRSSGILMPVFSLPSPYGIGTLGQAARTFVDFLKAAGQTWWQILPVGPTGYGDSPYQSFSAYAGNPYLIDLDLLREDGLLTQAEIDSAFWGAEPCQSGLWGSISEPAGGAFIACHRGWERDAEAVAQFSAENRNWLPDYALFMALKQHFGGKPRGCAGRRIFAFAGGKRWNGIGRRCQRMWRCLPIFSFCFSGSGMRSGPMPRSRGFGLSAICRFMWPWTPPMCGRSLKISSWTRS